MCLRGEVSWVSEAYTGLIRKDIKNFYIVRNSRDIYIKPAKAINYSFIIVSRE
jgi:hypothetical protein